jgi:hypothetical protein
MKALYYNILQDYSTINMTNEDSNFPIENIFSTYLTMYTKTTADNTKITITFTADQTADCFFLGFSNMAVASTIACVYKNGGGATIFTDNLVKTSWYIVKSYFTELTTIRSIEITITNATAAIFYIGTIWIGGKIDLPDFQSKPVSGYGNLATCEETVTGQVNGQVRGLRDRWEINFNYIQTDTILETIRNYVNGIGQLPHFIDLYENVTDKSYYAHMVNENIGWTPQNDTRFKHRDIKLLYRECL